MRSHLLRSEREENILFPCTRVACSFSCSSPRVLSMRGEPPLLLARLRRRWGGDARAKKFLHTNQENAQNQTFGARRGNLPTCRSHLSALPPLRMTFYPREIYISINSPKDFAISEGVTPSLELLLVVLKSKRSRKKSSLSQQKALVGESTKRCRFARNSSFFSTLHNSHPNTPTLQQWLASLPPSPAPSPPSRRPRSR